MLKYVHGYVNERHVLDENNCRCCFYQIRQVLRSQDSQSVWEDNGTCCHVCTNRCSVFLPPLIVSEYHARLLLNQAFSRGLTRQNSLFLQVTQKHVFWLLPLNGVGYGSSIEAYKVWDLDTSLSWSLMRCTDHHDFDIWSLIIYNIDLFWSWFIFFLQ